MTDTPPRHVVLTALSDIRAKRLRWLWRDHIPIGVIAMFAGRGGEGKSTFALHLASQLTNGTLPGDYEGQQHHVIYVAFEDDPASIVKPRALAAGADTAFVHTLAIRTEGSDWESSPSLVSDLADIERAIEQVGAVALIVDPLSSGMHGINRDRGSEVRPVLDGIASMAQRTGCAVLAIAHFSKGGGDVRDKLSGSHEYVDRSRAVLVFATDEDGSKIMQQTKGNYGPGDAGNVHFTLETRAVDVGGHAVEVGAVSIIGTTDRNVSDIINADTDEDGGALSDAQRWLIDYMERREAQTCPSKDLQAAARGDGISWTSVEAAKRNFNKKPAAVRKGRRFESGRSGVGWAWSLVEDAP